MSGGSMNYFYSTLEEYTNVLGDREMNDLVKDLCKVFHDKEWADSGDISDGAYNKTLSEFKDKWFTKEGTQKRREQYIENAIAELRSSFGQGSYCKDCAYWTPATRAKDYGQCKDNTGYLLHGYETACFEFAQKDT